MKLATTLAALTLATAALAQTAPSPKLIAQLDAASKSFKSAQASVSKDQLTYVLKVHETTTGTIFIERKGPGITMGATQSEEGSSGPAKIVYFDGSTLQMYTPGLNSVDVLKAGSNQAKFESFLTLGFGGSGSDLVKNWKVNDQGAEMVDGVSCEKLDLTPKDPSVTSTFTHVTIWIDPTRDVSVKQTFYAPNKDVQTAMYSNIKLNAAVNKKPYAIPSKATRVNR